MSVDIAEKVREYSDMKKMLNELQDILEALEQEIKVAMGNSEEMTVDGIKVRWTHYTVKRFDSKTFKSEHAAMYDQYAKSIQTRRFQVVA